MVQSLNELADYVRKTLPFSKAIMNLRIVEQAGGVTFIWQGVEFLVKQSLQAFEVRGNHVFITGLSMLLQAILVKGGQEEQRVASWIDALAQAEESLRLKHDVREAVHYVRAVREHLQKLAPQRAAAA